MAQYTIRQALQLMLNSSSWKNRYIQSKLRSDWEMLMGKTIAKYTTEVKIIEGTLVIKTQVAALKNELQLSKQLVIQKVNEHLKETIVKELIVT